MHTLVINRIISRLTKGHRCSISFLMFRLSPVTLRNTRNSPTFSRNFRNWQRKNSINWTTRRGNFSARSEYCPIFPKIHNSSDIYLHPFCCIHKALSEIIEQISHRSLTTSFTSWPSRRFSKYTRRRRRKDSRMDGSLRRFTNLVWVQLLRPYQPRERKFRLCVILWVNRPCRCFMEPLSPTHGVLTLRRSHRNGRQCRDCSTMNCRASTELLSHTLLIVSDSLLVTLCDVVLSVAFVCT